MIKGWRLALASVITAQTRQQPGDRGLTVSVVLSMTELPSLLLNPAGDGFEGVVGEKGALGGGGAPS
jgi:hypothetical protein